jgi:hypothetical protein
MSTKPRPIDIRAAVEQAKREWAAYPDWMKRVAVLRYPTLKETRNDNDR